MPNDNTIDRLHQVIQRQRREQLEQQARDAAAEAARQVELAERRRYAGVMRFNQTQRETSYDVSWENLLQTQVLEPMPDLPEPPAPIVKPKRKYVRKPKYKWMQATDLPEAKDYMCARCECTQSPPFVHFRPENSSTDKVYCSDCYREQYKPCKCCDEVVKRSLARPQVYDYRSSAEQEYLCTPCSNKQMQLHCTWCENFTVGLRQDSQGRRCCQTCQDYRALDLCAGCTTWQTCRQYGRTEPRCENDPDNFRCRNCRQSSSCECNACINTGGKLLLAGEYASRMLDDPPAAILQYHAPIYWKKYSASNDLKSDPHFGIELEIEINREHNRDRCVQAVGNNLANYACCMRDGSITHGFEIITTPMKLREFKKRNFKKLFEDLVAGKAISHDSKTCGLHVHVERVPWFNNPLGMKASGKITKEAAVSAKQLTNKELFQHFFWRMRKFIIPFSRREKAQMDRYCLLTPLNQSNKYVAVNLMSPHTVEIRIWNGTLNYDRFRASILMTFAMMEFCQMHKDEVIVLKPYDQLMPQLMNFIGANAKYQHLVKYIKEHHKFYWDIMDKRIGKIIEAEETEAVGVVAEPDPTRELFIRHGSLWYRLSYVRAMNPGRPIPQWGRQYTRAEATMSLRAEGHSRTSAQAAIEAMPYGIVPESEISF